MKWEVKLVQRSIINITLGQCQKTKMWSSIKPAHFYGEKKRMQQFPTGPDLKKKKNSLNLGLCPFVSTASLWMLITKLAYIILPDPQMHCLVFCIVSRNAKRKQRSCLQIFLVYFLLLNISKAKVDTHIMQICREQLKRFIYLLWKLFLKIRNVFWIFAKYASTKS